MKPSETQRRKKSFLVVCVALPVALLHFVTGEDYNGPFPVFVNGYLLDILLPLTFYLLLCLVEWRLLAYWWVKAGLVFGAATAVEIAQYFGAPLFGRTYDPVDFVMYALGVGLAVLLDRCVFVRAFRFWSLQTPGVNQDDRLVGLP